MSGGAFNYENYKIGDIARQIEEVVLHNQENEYYQYDAKTLQYLKMAVLVLEQADILCHRIDWLLSGDDGEESFKRLVEKQLNENTSKHIELVKELFGAHPEKTTLKDVLEDVTKEMP
jgi:hypothetical protein